MNEAQVLEAHLFQNITQKYAGPVMTLFLESKSGELLPARRARIPVVPGRHDTTADGPARTSGKKANQGTLRNALESCNDENISERIRLGIPPYKILLAEGNHTCSVADFYGTMKGPMKMPDGRVVQPTGKGFHVEFCTVATWDDKGEITEERLFYDQVGLRKQIGLM